ncbi:palmitoyltransferase ZDHHC13/17 [Mytilus galloprovincialis]|uniref:Palmitoyltransferase ZDHHC13/17 n=1 Tax=Mytilus galloprovincialis TaxID=29158 RepID=A0A8B6HJY9_MYTGA|nr:palmitoyltransferase ZDHHC13/17 [Mytilus galloprovincialis]
MNDEYFATLRNSLSLIHQDLTSEDLQLTVNERRKIYESYFKSDLPKSISDETLSLYNFYPLICSSYDKDYALKSLRHPNKIVSAEVYGMCTKEDIGYLVLAILVVLSNTVEKKIFSDTDPNEIVRDIFKESGFAESPTNHLLLKSFTSLQGEFTIFNGCIFSFLTTELFECVASCIGESFIHCILKHSSSKFIKEKLQLYSSSEFVCPYSIKVPRKMEDTFYHRLSLDMKGFHFADVLNNKLFQIPANRKTLISYFAAQMESKLCVNATTGSTVFHIVSSLGYSDLLGHFFQIYQYPNINSRNFNGEAPLHLACQNGNLQTVQHLIENKAEVNKMSTKNRTALHYACESGNQSVVICLIGNKASLNKKDKDGMTPLHLACERGYYEIVKILVDKKADINEQGVITGRTPLHYACEHNFRNIVHFLISKKANVNKTDVLGSTPLHIACINGKEEIVKLLLNKQALTNVKNKQGQTPVNIAFQNGFEKITSLLAPNKPNK